MLVMVYNHPKETTLLPIYSKNTIIFFMHKVLREPIPEL